MKYLSLVLILLLVGFTWHVSHRERLIEYSIHSDIQNDVAAIIEAAVMQQLSSVKKVNFDRLYSETIDPSTVRVHFQYRFSNIEQTNEEVESQIRGSAMVQRDPNNFMQWVLSKIDLEGSSVEFKEGTVITVDPQVQNSESTTTDSTEETSHQ